MSSIYIHEPPTLGKVMLRTTFGDIDIELWSREAPKACRNFIQLCADGFYDGIIFHRVIKKFIAQTGDPTGTGCESVSTYGKPFKDEIHSRLRFCRRGLVALANHGKDDNGSQFFFTLDATPELQGKHTIFGKVVDDTQYNLLKLNEVLVDQDDRPIYETKIIKTKILDNPFDDIVPRINKKKEQKVECEKIKKKEAGVKNYKLLSFGEEAEEDEIETIAETKKFEGRSKSTHDILNDPKLSSLSVLDVEDKCQENEDEGKQEENLSKQLETVKNKLGKKTKEDKKEETKTPKVKEEEDDDIEGDNYFAMQREKDKQKKLESIRKEIKSFKREYRDEQKTKHEEDVAERKKTDQKSEILKEYEAEQQKYVNLTKKIPPKGIKREVETFSKLQNFLEKLKSVREEPSENEHKKETENENDLDDVSGLIWLKSQLIEESAPQGVLAKDANTKADDWYEIFDPRNPINKRRRENNKQDSSKKRK